MQFRAGEETESGKIFTVCYRDCQVSLANRLCLFVGSLLAANETTGKDDSRHGEVCCTQGSYYYSVSDSHDTSYRWVS